MAFEMFLLDAHKRTRTLSYIHTHQIGAHINTTKPRLQRAERWIFNGCINAKTGYHVCKSYKDRKYSTHAFILNLFDLVFQFYYCSSFFNYRQPFFFHPVAMSCFIVCDFCSFPLFFYSKKVRENFILSFLCSFFVFPLIHSVFTLRTCTKTQALSHTEKKHSHVSIHELRWLHLQKVCPKKKKKEIKNNAKSKMNELAMEMGSKKHRAKTEKKKCKHTKQPRKTNPKTW